MRELDYLVVEAKDNQHILTQLIEQNELFIIKCTAKATHRYVSKSDDEYSIALLAFHETVKNYELNKGSFLKFAELVIKRRLIDYYRKQEKHNVEITVNPSLFDSDPEKDQETLSLRLAVAQKVCQKDNSSIKLEIESANELFCAYGFSFFELASCSPKSTRTKAFCAKAVCYILSNPFMITELRRSKQLSLKIIEKNAGVPRKILERHRKYIIAAIEILSGEYPQLAEYLRFIRKGIEK